MIVEVNLEFLDEYKNCFTETIEIAVSEDEENIEAVIEDRITDWFLQSAKELFKKAYPSFNPLDEEWGEKFGLYLMNSKMWGDLE